MHHDGWTSHEEMERRTLELAKIFRERQEAVEHYAMTVQESYGQGAAEIPGAVDHEEKKRYFSPPMGTQRNQFVQAELFAFKQSGGTLKKLAVLGCGEGAFEYYSRQKFPLLGIESIVSVDLNRAAARRALERLEMFARHDEDRPGKIHGRPTSMEAWRGDVTEYHECLQGADAVICVEVIEHMPVEKSEKVMHLILDLIQPEIAIITTPNFDFNKNFHDMKSKYRDADHHYEFTVKEFEAWIEKMKRPEAYMVDITFVGYLDSREPDEFSDDDLFPFDRIQMSPPAMRPIKEIFHDKETLDRHFESQDEAVENENVGGCTQVAIFRRHPNVAKRTILLDNYRYYEKVGAVVIPYGIFTVLRSASQQAMVTYLKEGLLNLCEIRQQENFSFYMVPLKEVMAKSSSPDFQYMMEKFPHHACRNIASGSHDYMIAVQDRFNGELQWGLKVPTHIPVKELISYLTDIDY